MDHEASGILFKSSQKESQAHSASAPAAPLHDTVTPAASTAESDGESVEELMNVSEADPVVLLAPHVPAKDSLILSF